MGKPSTKKQKTSSKLQPNMSSGARITDPRFANIQSDPRYRLPGKKNKVKLDKRFARVLQEEDFVKRAKVDRYGRALKSDAERNRLKRKYEFDEDEDVEEAESDALDDDDVVQRELSRVEKKTHDPLREGRATDSESSDEATSEEETSEEDEDELDLNEGVGVGSTQQTDVPTGEVTSRIAIVNLDWDNIRASDLMAVFSSFLPSSGGSLLRVAIYPSEFGKERLEREEMEGPPKEIFANAAKENYDDVSEDEEEGDEDIKKSILQNENGDEDFNPTALRKYQLERLRYFYSILTFSSPSVAKHIYDAVDGTEYLRTANFFDLRFVPDDTDFSADVPREDCERIPDDYKPNEFVTDALQHSKVKLTWDAEDTGRKEAVARAFKGGRGKGRKGTNEMMDENDLRAYLASDDSDDDGEDKDDELAAGANDDAVGAPLSKKEAERHRMRALLGLPAKPEKRLSKKKEKAPVGDMQITFTSGLSSTTNKNGNKKRSVFENSPEPEETTLEKYVRKERERKQERKDKVKASHEGNIAPEPETNDKAAKEAANEIIQEEQEEDEENLGFNDPFFASNQPSASTEKSTSNKLRKEERLQKRKQREAEDEEDRKQRAELEVLMADDDGAAGRKGKMRHFDMREIERAEKEARKKNKKGGKGKSKDPSKSKHAEGDGDAQDGFELDTADSRFTRLFSSHEYAIDPTNPRFKGTKGMKALLDEGRKRKQFGGIQNGGAIEDKERKDKSAVGFSSTKTGKTGAEQEGRADMKNLVEKIKRRQKS